MAVAPTLNRDQQNFMIAECGKLMTAGKAAIDGLFVIDPVTVKSAHDFLLKYDVIKKPVDLQAAFVPSFLDSIPLAERKV